MKVRGTSDFNVASAMSRNDVQQAMRGALDRYMSEHPEVLDATVVLVGDTELRVQIVLRSDGFGAAEDVMTDVGPLLATAVGSGSATSSVTPGATELVPA